MKTIAEQRIYLDEAHELHELLTDKWVQALLEVGNVVIINIKLIIIIAFIIVITLTIFTTRYMTRQQLTYRTALRR